MRPRIISNYQGCKSGRESSFRIQSGKWNAARHLRLQRQTAQVLTAGCHARVKVGTCCVADGPREGQRLHEACVFSGQMACVPAPALRCGAVTTMREPCAAFAARTLCCVIGGAASNAATEVAAANQMKRRPVASTDENATVSLFNWGFKSFLAVAFMIYFLSVLVACNVAPD